MRQDFMGYPGQGEKSDATVDGERQAYLPVPSIGQMAHYIEATMSELENAFDIQLSFAAVKIPVPEREYKFHPDRRWRADFCWIEEKIIVEIDGGTYSGGRHTRGGGFQKDCEKLNAAAELGFRVFRFTGKDVRQLGALRQMERVFG